MLLSPLPFALRAPRSNLICSNTGDPGPGGGGGTPPGGTGTPPPEDDEAKTSRMINAAVTSQLSRKLPAMVQQAVTEVVPTIVSQIRESLQTTPPGNQGQGDKGNKPDPQVTAMQNQIKQLENQRVADAMNARNSENDSQLRQALTVAGVRPELMAGALATLRGNVHTPVDDKGMPSGPSVYKAQRQGWEEEVSIEAGVKEWAATDQGKAHLAPVQVSGSGNRPGSRGGTRPGPTPPDPAQAKAMKKREAGKKLMQGMAQLVAGGGSIALTGGGQGGGTE